ncbi:hypothetical protein [Brunnivagina elsteri]|uniref:Uncharacterized protein n=1 Tax=Brunnivagina elsteri CCALA 953 TaxID=987040 RepID=A0A2A2TMG1_9CYAN|nr:hypothetical protein [Calothrix elsteri]PAX58373.1 hypothetical protein CK510_07840 [Calothrix elsteri CCALA 953]
MTSPENIDEAIEYFRDLGIEPIVLEQGNEDSLANLLNAVTEAITGTEVQTTSPLDTQNNDGTNHQ